MDPSLQTTADQLAQARAQGDGARLAEALLVHANALLRVGQVAQAGDAVDEARDLHHQRGAPADELRCLLFAAEILRLQGRTEEAASRAHDGLALAAPASADRAQALAVVGEIALSAGAASAAEAALDEALALAAPAAPAWWRARARARAAQGRFDGAASDLEAAQARCVALGDGVAARRAAIEAATAWHQARQPDRAAVLVARTLVEAHAAHDHAALGALELLNTTAALERRDADAAHTHALAARQHALDARAPDTYIGAAAALSRLADHAGDRATAYGTLATGWATVGDLLGPDLARSSFEPLLRALHLQWGAPAFDAARAAYEASRRP